MVLLREISYFIIFKKNDFSLRFKLKPYRLTCFKESTFHLRLKVRHEKRNVNRELGNSEQQRSSYM